MISVFFTMIATVASVGFFGLVWIGIKRLQKNNAKTSIEPLSISSIINRRVGAACSQPRLLTGLDSCLGQGVVEFTLMFLLFLVVAWIPADFGLAMYTGQLALNASREGARIAAADPTLATGTTTCTLPACYSLADGTILKETANRISSALMPGATIRVCYPVASVNPVNPDGTCNSPVGGGSTCNAQLAVTVTGNYNYFFYSLLRFLGASVPPYVQIIRSTQMRWEHQNTCT